MKTKGWNAARLAEMSNLSKTTISRIQRNSNDKGGPYNPTENAVAAIAIAFRIGQSGWRKLMFAAFPDRRIWLDSLEKGRSVIETNELLFDRGCPLLGNAKTE